MLYPTPRHRLPLAVLALALVLGPGAGWSASYDEAVDGDLSGNRLAPTAFLLEGGSNLLSADMQLGDLEYVTVTVPGGLALDSVILDAFISSDNIAFAAVQSGATFTEDPGTPNPANMLGLTHFGTAVGAATTNVGGDLLDNMGAGVFGGLGFAQPLPSGDYTFWLQQTSPVLVVYRLDFVLAPEPGTAVLLLVGIAGLRGARRRSR